MELEVLDLRWYCHVIIYKGLCPFNSEKCNIYNQTHHQATLLFFIVFIDLVVSEERVMNCASCACFSCDTDGGHVLRTMVGVDYGSNEADYR